MACILVTSQESVSATHALLANRRRGCGVIWGGYSGRLRELDRPVAHSKTYSSVTHGNTIHVHPEAIADFMGHSSISTTMDVYGHLSKGVKSEAVAEIDKHLVEGGFA